VKRDALNKTRLELSHYDGDFQPQRLTFEQMSRYLFVSWVVFKEEFPTRENISWMQNEFEKLLERPGVCRKERG
jgi:hypothetical protein